MDTCNSTRLWACLATAACFAAAGARSLAVPLPFTAGIAVNTGSFPRAEAVVAADINRDGRADLVAANTNSIVCWFGINSSGTNWIRQTVEASMAGLNSVFVQDIDRDGDPDILGAAGGTTDTVAWWRNTDGSGTNWTKHTVDAAFDGARGVIAADINGDAIPDAVAVAATANEIAWWRQTDATGTNWSKNVIASGFGGATSAQAHDIDGDGDLDVAGTAGSGNEVAWWENTDGTGTNWTHRLIDGNAPGAQNVVIADIDGDGDPDTAFSANSGDAVTWCENLDGEGGSWTSHVVAAGFDGAYGLFAHDIDGDGDMDLLATAQIDDDVVWIENTAGDGSAWTFRTIDPIFDGTRSVYPSDIDGDGDTDIAAAAFIENKVSWWENLLIHRSASFCTAITVSTTFEGAQSVVVYDLDQDGDDDVIGAAAADNRVSWWENANGAGSVWLERKIDTNAMSAWSIFPADIDGDGTPDVLGVSRQAGAIFW